MKLMYINTLPGRHYTERCDVFSFAIVVWEIITRKRPILSVKGQNASSMAILYAMANGETSLLLPLPLFLPPFLPPNFPSLHSLSYIPSFPSLLSLPPSPLTLSLAVSILLRMTRE